MTALPPPQRHRIAPPATPSTRHSKATTELTEAITRKHHLNCCTRMPVSIVESRARLYASVGTAPRSLCT